jgi:hypothetical protein
MPEMDASGRTLRTRTIVPATRSPKKSSATNKKRKGTGNGGKAAGKGKHGSGEMARGGKGIVAMETAKDYLGDESEDDSEVEEEVVGAKRARKDGEGLEVKEAQQVAEAKQLVENWMETDIYILEIDKRRQNVQDSLSTYQTKAALVKDLPKSAKKTAKQFELKEKIVSIQGKLSSLDKLTQKRLDELFDAAHKKVMDARRPAKKRRMMKEVSEEDGLDVSDGKLPLPYLLGLHCFPPTLDDCPSLGDRPMHSYKGMDMHLFYRPRQHAPALPTPLHPPPPEAPVVGYWVSNSTQLSCPLSMQLYCYTSLAALLPRRLLQSSLSDAGALPGHYHDLQSLS